MTRTRAFVAALLVALAFGASYALSASGGEEPRPRVELPGRAAAPLKVSESALRTQLLGAANRIPGTLSSLPAAPAAASSPAPAASPPPPPSPPASSAPVTPAPVSPAPAPPPPPPAPAPAPQPAPAPAPDDGPPTFDDSG